MSDYIAEIDWRRGDQAFVDNHYSRAHDWRFDGGAVVRGSSAPSSVPVPMSDPAAVDPEEAVVAAASSCHMLFFLAFAAKAAWVVERYRDRAVGVMGRDERGRTALTRIALRPQIDWYGPAPSPEDLAQLHHRAHDSCYIANSLRCPVVIEG
jgi:organic hydroperoxide reductase OsmC/OhrA